MGARSPDPRSARTPPALAQIKLVPRGREWLRLCWAGGAQSSGEEEGRRGRGGGEKGAEGRGGRREWRRGWKEKGEGEEGRKRWRGA